jgi:hypothetical protein
MNKKYNLGRSIRKALTAFFIALLPQLINLKRFPAPEEMWIAVLIGAFAFFLTLQKEEESKEASHKGKKEKNPTSFRRMLVNEWLP